MLSRLLIAAFGLGLLLSPMAMAQQPPATQPKKPTFVRPAPKPPTPEEKAAAEALAAEQQRIKPIKDAIKVGRNKINGIKTSGVIAEQDKAEVDQFFTNYVDLISSFAEAAEAPNNRQTLRGIIRLIGNAPDKSALAYINNLLLTRFSEVAWSDKFTPQARYMCMLAIAELNEQEPTTGGTGTVKPMPQALPVLHKAVMDADMLQAVKVAALIGIIRQAKAGIADKALERTIVVDMAALAKEKNPATDDGHQWMRRQALEILAALKQPGPGNEVVPVLTAIALDKTEQPSTRLDALRALGQLKAPANSVGEATPQIGALTLDLLRNQTSRRALRFGLQSLQMGLRGQDGQGGMVPGLSGQDKKRAEELSRKIANWHTFVEKTSSAAGAETQVMAEIQNEANNLEAWLAEQAEAAAEAAAAAGAQQTP